MSSNVDIDQLSPAQQAALQQYTSVTDQEVSASIPILERAQWNVQIAVTRFFDGETEQTDAVPATTTADTATLPGRTRTGSVLIDEPRLPRSRSPPRADSAPRIVPQPQHQVVRQPPFLLSIILMPFSLLYKIASSTFGLFAYLFPFLPRLFKQQQGPTGTRPSVTSGRRMLNPRDTAARFIREFEEEYGSNDLPFYNNGYAQALDAAKKDLKLLLIVLLSPEHDDTRSFVQDSLLSPEFVRFINDPSNNLILWAGNVRDSEAYQVSTALRCTKFPFTALISQTKERNAPQMSVVGRIAGPSPPGSYVAKLRGAVNTHLVQLNEVRNARAAQDFERTIRQEQDSAYERSLAQDRERARLRREQEAAEAAARQLASQQKEEEEKYAANLAQWRKWRAQSIKPEPEADAKDVVRIAVRMPESAERVTRRFAADATIEELYAFVECYDVLSEEAGPRGTVDEPVGFKHEYKFHLVSPMPRAVYDIEEGGSLLERIGRSGNLIVEPIDNESDAEDE